MPFHRNEIFLYLVLNRAWPLVFIFLVLLVLALYSGHRIRKKMKTQQAEIRKIKHLLKQKILQARMNPHFLFNSLNSIQYFIAGDDKKASLEYVSRFSSFLRQLLRLGDELSVSVRDEADLLHQYLWLEQTRFSGRFEYEIKVQETALPASIPPLMVHGLVEEALYQSVLNSREGEVGKIAVSFNCQEERLLVFVTSNSSRQEAIAVPGKMKRLVSEESILLPERIRLFNRQSEKKITLQYTTPKTGSENGINRARLEVPQPLFD